MAAIKTWRRSEDGMDGWIDQLNSFAHGTGSHDVVVVLGCKIQSPEQLCVVDILPIGISKRVQTSAGPCVAICDGHCLEAY